MSNIRYVTNDSRLVANGVNDTVVDKIELDFNTLSTKRLVFVDKATRQNYMLDINDNNITLTQV